MDIGVGSYISSKSLNELNFIIVRSTIYILFRIRRVNLRNRTAVPQEGQGRGFSCTLPLSPILQRSMTMAHRYSFGQGSVAHDLVQK